MGQAHRFDPRQVAKLEDPERLRWQPPAVVLGLLALRGDDTVVDYGAGSGVYTLPLAEALPEGRVLAVDVSGEMLARLREHLAAHPQLATRVETFLVPDDGADIGLPAGAADAVLAVNLWHEIDDDAAALDAIVAVLRPGGRLVIVDWAPVERPVGPPGHHVLTSDQARAVVGGMGLRVVAVHEPGELLPYHWTLVATKEDGDE